MTTQLKGKVRPMLEPGFNPELAGLHAPDNGERIAACSAKLKPVEPEDCEMSKVFRLILSINENFAAEADVVMNWEHREMVIIIDEGGATVYVAALQIDSPALDAKLRLVRHEIEQMQVAALCGLKWEAA